jgi:YesN/AraC family two-component response regulator
MPKDREMIRNLSLSYFQAEPACKYHIYRISGSETSQSFHSHDFFQICYVDKGEVLHCDNDSDAKLVYGDAFIVPPKFVHKIVFPDTNAAIYSLSFEKDMFHSGFSSSNVSRFMTALTLDCPKGEHINVRMKTRLDKNQRYIMKSLLESLIKETESKYPAALSSSASLIAAIMCILSQAYFLDSQHQESYKCITRYSTSIQACLEYIDNYFTMPLTVDDLARKFALSNTTFSILFSQVTGTTFKRYTTQKRIEHACILMISTTLSLNEISRMAGYNDFSTFYRNFVKIVGISPSEYRNANKNR